MTLVGYYLFLILSIPLVSVILLKINDKKNGLIFKIISLTLALVFICRYMWADDAIEEMFKLSSVVFEGRFKNFVALLLVWLTYSSSLLLCLYGFFKIKLYNKFIYFIALPISLLNLFLFSIHYKAITGADALSGFTARGVLLALEIGISIGYCIAIILKNINFKNLFKKKERVDKEKQRLTFKMAVGNTVSYVKSHWIVVFAFLVVLLSTIPIYAIQGFFGRHYSFLDCLDLEFPHRLVLYIGVILPIVIHVSLHAQSYEEKKFYLLYICLGTLLTYSISHKFKSFLDPTDWPLHLCNTAMYIMPVVLMFNMKKFFYFTYFINVAGAFLAMVMPNYKAELNLFSPELVRFYVNHFIAFFMPILFVSLGMFEKPKFKQVLYSLAGFLGYFLFVLFVNALFTGLYEIGKASDTTDYFFINSNFIASKLGGWATALRSFKAVIKVGNIKLTFFPIYQTIFFLVYVLISFAMWFIYAQGFDIAERITEIGHRKEKIRLDLLALDLKGENMKQPLTPENKDKLVLINFSKKYGSSTTYAVKDANLEVNCGEIFGFLGPNGAGKSTIIKSIVGIQPITSGRIEVCGYDMGTQGIEAKSNLGFVPDHYALYEKLTGREYINYIADLYNVSKQERDERIESMVTRFELNHSFDNQIKTYSHGMKQKIAIMAALVHNPKIWILDEPLTGLDPNSIFQVKECMKEHARNGNIVFFSSHIIDVVEKICDKIAIIKKGQILCTKTVEEIEGGGTSLENFYMDLINN